MIKINHAHKYFNKGKRNQVHVINDTTLSLDNTGLVAILGPSGCGKTTLLNAIGGLDKIEKGEIFIDDKKISGKSASYIDKVRNLEIGYIFQDYKLVDNVSVYENVRMQLRMIGIKDEKEIEKRINYVLETLGIYRYRNRLAKMLSGGERQRVGIARAIAKNPRIIIADEPTGNLDSKNTIEIMNILKKISESRLVILVTHEVDLAKFYASRIIELKDGVLVKDYENVVDKNLDYKFDNKIYLKDFEKEEHIEKAGINLNFYGDKESNLDFDIVIRHGNIYIRTKNNDRVEVIDQNSQIELVDDHYREIDKDTYKDYEFNFDKVVDTRFKEKYSSIVSIFKSIGDGFKKIGQYTTLRKILLLGFLVASMFITYAFSSIYAGNEVKDEDFIQTNKDYIKVEIPSIDVEKYNSLKQIDNVTYIFPSDENVRFTLLCDWYYQTYYAQANLEGGATKLSRLNESDIVCGRMPENKYEIVIDKFAINKAMENNDLKMVGLFDAEQIIGETVYAQDLKPFTIVGLTDQVQPVVYIDDEIFMDVVFLAKNFVGSYEIEQDPYGEIYDYKEFKKDFTLKQGKYPEHIYETLVPYEMRYEYKIGKNVSYRINGNKLKVVGYYEIDDDASYINPYLVNIDTIEAKMISQTEVLTICSDNKASVVSYLTETGISAEDSYEFSRQLYVDTKHEMVKSMIITSLIMLIISLIEIYLMMRSSFLSRVKEVGILRAVGVKKIDIYKMFFGETFAISTIASLPGIIAMSYILYNLTKIKYLATAYAMNPLVFFSAIIVCYVFNSLVGLIPVFTTMTKTPAQILSRYDVD